MLYNDFCDEFNICLNEGDYASANEVIMRELGGVLVRKKKDFVHLLNESGVPSEMSDTDMQLIDNFVNNVPYNKNLMVGASLLVNMQNKQLNFDGTSKVSNENIKNGYHVMKTYFIDENYSNAVDPISAVAATVTAGLNLGKNVQEGKNKQKTAGLDLAQKREESKQAMITSALAAKQANYDAQKKAQETKMQTQKVLYIVGGSILAIAVIGLIIYKVKKGK
jgi:hypothetical protein